MMNWAVTLEAHIDGEDTDIIDAADAYLDVLSRRAELFGPVMSIDLRNRTLRARFDLEAVDFGAAARHAADLGAQTLAELNIAGIEILRAEIESTLVGDVLTTHEVLHV